MILSRWETTAWSSGERYSVPAKVARCDGPHDRGSELQAGRATALIDSRALVRVLLRGSNSPEMRCR